MARVNPPNDKNMINLKLAEVIRNLPQEHQLILLKQLLQGDLAPTLYRLIGKMTDEQQTALLEQLQEHSFRPISLDETEIAMRGYTRKSCMLNIDYSVDERDFEGFMLDISPAGAFIETGEPFTTGQQISISFSLPSNIEKLNINGEILWKGMLGIGVKFNDPDPRLVDLISAYMENEEI